MRATAARLGSSAIRLDWSGLHQRELDQEDLNLCVKEWNKLKARLDYNTMDAAFYEAVVNDEISNLSQCVELANHFETKRDLTHVLCIGIGGSSLGPISLLEALSYRKAKRQITFVENPDPIHLKATLNQLDPASTLVVAITKSGTTFETIAVFRKAMEWLTPARWKEQIVVITDPEKGDLRALASARGLHSLPIHPKMGGRFSLFSPVGLFPCLLAGYSAQSFIEGAKKVRDAIEKLPAEKNPLFLLAHGMIAQAKSRPIHVLMPYATLLRSFGAWYVQLWAESLGKNHKGFTPIGALGANDQHSILQLLRDGPDDKWTCFVTLAEWGDEKPLPGSEQGLSGLAAFRILDHVKLSDLLNIEARSIQLVLTKQNRPTWNIQLERLDEASLGAFCFFWSTLTAFTGTLWEIDPFDQPGVEEGKIYIKEALMAQERDHIRAEQEDDPNSPVNRLRRS